MTSAIGMLVASLDNDEIARGALLDSLKEEGQEEAADRLGQLLVIEDRAKNKLQEYKKRLEEFPQYPDGEDWEKIAFCNGAIQVLEFLLTAGKSRDANLSKSCQD